MHDEIKFAVVIFMNATHSIALIPIKVLNIAALVGKRFLIDIYYRSA